MSDRRKVVTSGAAGLTAGLKSEAAYIKLPQEVLDVIVENTLQGNTDYYRNSQFEVRTEIRKMSNVLLIPKQAVKEKMETHMSISKTVMER